MIEQVLGAREPHGSKRLVERQGSRQCYGSLIAFGLVLTRIDSAFAGRAYAAYGGIYIAASLIWLWVVEGQRRREPM